jgi:hypothetical protein
VELEASFQKHQRLLPPNPPPPHPYLPVSLFFRLRNLRAVRWQQEGGRRDRWLDDRSRSTRRLRAPSSLGTTRREFLLRLRACGMWGAEVCGDGGVVAECVVECVEGCME